MISESYIPNDARLQNAVRLFWQIDRGNTLFNSEVIIPKGTAELIFNLHGAPLQGCINRQTLSIPRCFISSFNNVPIQLSIPYKQIFFGVNCTPIHLKHLFKVPLDSFVNSCIDLTLVDASLTTLWHQLGEADNFMERVHLFIHWILQRLPGTTPHEDLFNAFLTSPVSAISSVPQLSQHLCYSPRQLSRKLHQLIGMNAEQTLLFQKYVHSIHLMHRSNLSLTQIAHACAFSDQSHFIKTFKAFAQLTPTEYRNSLGPVPGHIFSNVR